MYVCTSIKPVCIVVILWTISKLANVLDENLLLILADGMVMVVWAVLFFSVCVNGYVCGATVVVVVVVEIGIFIVDDDVFGTTIDCAFRLFR